MPEDNTVDYAPGWSIITCTVLSWFNQGNDGLCPILLRNTFVHTQTHPHTHIFQLLTDTYCDCIFVVGWILVVPVWAGVCFGHCRFAKGLVCTRLRLYLLYQWQYLLTGMFCHCRNVSNVFLKDYLTYELIGSSDEIRLVIYNIFIQVLGVKGLRQSIKRQPNVLYRTCWM